MIQEDGGRDPAAGPRPPAFTSRTAPFRRRVRECLAPALVAVAPDISIEIAVRRMTAAETSAVLVVADDGRPAGIVTERDVVSRGRDRSRAVAEIMSAPVMTGRVDDRLYRAIAVMRANRLRHLAIVDDAGKVAGLLELHEALAAAACSPDGIGGAARIDRLEESAATRSIEIALARHLDADGVAAPEILALVADLNRELHERVLELALAEMGSPPVPFACFVMGSGGRGESLLNADQDHGFVLADYPDEHHLEIDSWFVDLAERLVSGLGRAGLARCDGGVMATNPVWRKTQAQWRAQVAIWMEGRVPEVLLNCDILFDFRHVWGDFPLFDQLARDLVEAAAADRRFQMLMFGLQRDHRAAIGLFGRLQTEHEASDHRGWIDLKQRGTLPLVEAVRLLALARGVSVTGTLDRIAALQVTGALDANDADRLAAAFGNLASLQLRQQLIDHAAGRAMGNLVDPGRLTGRQHELLRADLRAINDFRSRLRADLTGSLL